MYISASTEPFLTVAKLKNGRQNVYFDVAGFFQ